MTNIYTVTATRTVRNARGGIDHTERAQVLEDGATEAVYETLAEAEAARNEAMTIGAEAIGVDPEDLSVEIEEVDVEFAIGARVEGGDRWADYDTGKVTGYSLRGDRLDVTVQWDSGSRTDSTASGSLLRAEGEDSPPSDEQIEALRDEAAAAGDMEQVALCERVLNHEDFVSPAAEDVWARNIDACWQTIRAARRAA